MTTPLQRAARGDASAIDQVVDAHSGLVWRVVRRRLGPGHPDLEDAMQDTFADVWRSAARFDPARGTEAAFIAQIAARRAIDIARRRAPSPGGDAAEGIAEAKPERNAVAMDGEVIEAIRGLRDEEQDALRLRYHAGMSYEQIAIAMDSKPATIRGWVFRGLRRLQDRLGSAAAADVSASQGADHD